MKGIVVLPGDGTILSIAKLESGTHVFWLDRTINSILARIL